MTTLAQVSINAPNIEYGQISPILIVLGAAVVGVLVEAFVPRSSRRIVQLVVALVGLVAAFVAVVLLAGTESIAAQAALAIDGPTLFLQGTILVLAMFFVLINLFVDILQTAVDPRIKRA